MGCLSSISRLAVKAGHSYLLILAVAIFQIVKEASQFSSGLRASVMTHPSWDYLLTLAVGTDWFPA